MLRLLLFVLFFPFAVLAQLNTLPLRHLTVADGLPQSSITALTQGPDGFLWIGSQGGLARYDGYDFKIFRSEQNNPNSLSHNFIWDLTFDDEGILWITTLGNGLSRFDPRTEQFSHILFAEADTGLYHWNTFSTLKTENILWVGTNESLDRVDLSTGKCRSYFPGREDIDSEPSILVRCLAMGADSSKLWMNSRKGLACLDLKTDTFTYLRSSPFGTHTDLSNIFTIEDNENQLTIATSRNVLLIDWANETETVLYSADSLGLATNLSFHGYKRGRGKYDYIYSGDGVFCIEKTSGKIASQLKHNDEASESLTHDHVISICETTDGVLWLGTRQGLSAARTKSGDFQRFGTTAESGKSLSAEAIQGIVYMPDDKLWVGMQKGIDEIDLNTGEIRNVNTFLDKPIGEEQLYNLCMIRDAEGIVWYGAKGGGLTKIYVKPDGTYTSSTDLLNNASVQTILDEDSILWIGTGGDGLLKYHKSKGRVAAYPFTGDSRGPSHTYVYALFRDSFGNFWLGTPTGGINLFDEESETFIAIRKASHNSNGLSGNTVLSFLEDSQSRVWVGTSTGLSRLEAKAGDNMFSRVKSDPDYLQFKHFGREAGFENEVIYGIIEDDKGLYWISTDEGLVCFDGQRVVETYSVADGCRVDEYNQNAYLKIPDGKMVFGGINGLEIFHPDKLTQYDYVPNTVIYSIEVNYKPLESGEHALADFNRRNVELGYRDRVISFEFAALSFVNSEENQYAYRLIGFDEEWTYTNSDRRMATYTSLDPGDYRFEVKAANCDGVWATEATMLDISVAYPPWQRWYSFLAYALIFSIILYSFLHWQNEKARRQERMKLQVEKARLEERELFRKRASQDFHDEAGNKVTRINLLVELAKSTLGKAPEVHEYLNKIASNTSVLSSGMRDFNWSLDPDKDSLADLVLRLREFGESMYEGDERNFSVVVDASNSESVKLEMGLRRDLLMVFKEAINNAVKYSGSNKATLKIGYSSRILELTLADFGKGFPENMETRGYGLTNMASRAGKHQAEFSYSSDPQLGAVIFIKVNLPHLG